MADFQTELEEIWRLLKTHVPESDPLRADTGEYLENGEWGIACEAMAILTKRYRQDTVIFPLLEPLMEQLILKEAEEG